MAASPRYMKKKVRAGDIEVDPNEMALLVHYDVEATVLGAQGESMESKAQHNTKKIVLSSLTEHSDIPQLAAEIVAKCELIHPSKQGLVEKLCYELQARVGDERSYFNQQRKLSRMGDLMQPTATSGGARANINKLEDYIEMLYEEGEQQNDALLLLLQLAEGPDYLESLCANEPLLLALGRLLTDGQAKGGDIVANVMHFFFSLSKYSHFHALVTRYKIGSTALQILEFETKRHAVWLEDLRKKEQAVVDDRNSGSQETLQTALKQLRAKERRQERLIYVSLHLLLNLAEDVPTQKKMVNKGIVPHLVAILERRNVDLLILVLDFLKLLSVYSENKDQMLEVDIIAKLAPLLGAKNTGLVLASMSLLYNLAFDTAVRKNMVKYGVIPHLAALVDTPDLRSHALRLMYQLSLDDSSKSVFAFTNVIPTLREAILQWQDRYVQPEMMALAINLATNPRNAQIFCEEDGLKNFVARVSNTLDALLMKMIRNLSAHDGDIKMLFLDFIDEIVNLVQNAPAPNFQVEALGLLANLSIDNFNYQKLVEEYRLIEFVQQLLVPEVVEDDIVLEAVNFVGMIAIDPNCAEILAESNIIPCLMDLMSAKQEDDELVLQIAYAFYYCVLHPPTFDALMGQQHAMAYLVDLLQDKNSEIRRLASLVLDVVVEHDPKYAEQIRRKKFEAHNAEWLQLMESEEGPARGQPDWDDYDDDRRRADPWAQNVFLDSSALTGGDEDLYDDDDVFV